MRRILMAAAFMLALPAAAQEVDSTQIAMEVGGVLASEGVRGMSYDQVAIQNCIDENVPSEDMAFAGELGLMTQGAQFQISRMSENSKKVHCRAIEATARQYGFIE